MKKYISVILIFLCFVAIPIVVAFGDNNSNATAITLEVGKTYDFTDMTNAYEYYIRYNWYTSNNCIEILTDTSQKYYCTIKGISEGTSRLYCYVYSETALGQYEEHTDSWSVVVEKSTITVTLDSQGGRVSTYTITGKPGEKYGTLPTPKKTGYTFDGWYTSGEERVFSTSLLPENSTTIYAHWTENTYTIHFDGNGSTDGSMEDMTDCLYSSSYQLNSNNFARDNYIFEEWNTSKYASGNSYTDEAIVSKLTSSPGGTKTLYAVWYDPTKDISKCSILLSSESVSYNGEAHNVSVVARNGSTLLQDGTDYLLSYENNINVGEASVTITGIGDYSGSQTKLFVITKVDQNIQLELDNSELPKSSTLQLTPSAYGSFSYESSNSAVATVSETGLVTGVSEGSVTITITVSGDETHSIATKKINLTVTHQIDMCGENLYWNFSDGTLSITGIGEMWTYDYNKFPWYSYRNEITEVIISDEVTSLSDEAFINYGNLISVNLGNGIVKIGNYCFSGCSSLAYISLPDTVASIGMCAFRSTSLLNITIPHNVTSIGDNAFKGCSKLTSIRFSGSAPTITNTSFTNVTAIAYYPQDEASWTSTVMKDYGGTITWKTWIPVPSFPLSGSCGDNVTWKLDENGLLTLSGSGAMYNYTASSKAPWAGYYDFIIALVIENDITSIGSYAFDSLSNLSSVFFSENIVRIGNYTFNGCTSLKSLVIPNSVTSIGKYAFAYCRSLKAIELQEGLTSIGEYAFYYCITLENITIPIGVTKINSNTFNNCRGLYSVLLPEGITCIGQESFYKCYCLKTISLPDSLKTIELYAFCHCRSLVSINLPETMETIGGHVFQGCSNLTSIVIPSGITTLEEYTFEDCYRLKEVNLPEDLTSIGYGVFQGCELLTDITIPEKVTTIGKYAFEYCYQLKSFAIPYGVTCIEEEAFCKCKSLVNVEIPSTVTTIGLDAFSYCESLKSIVIPEGVVSINDYAFRYCTNLRRVVMPSSTTSFGSKIFYSADNVVLVVNSGSTALQYALDNSITYVLSGSEAYLSIPDAFHEVKTGESLKLSAKLTNIDTQTYYSEYGNLLWESSNTDILSFTDEHEWDGESEFSVTASTNGTGVVTVKAISLDDSAAYASCTVIVHNTNPALIPTTLSVIEEEAFQGANFEEVILPESLKYVGDSSFRSCANLKLITIPDSVITIGINSFSGCSDLTILCNTNSIAYEYALNNDIPYIILQ